MKCYYVFVHGSIVKHLLGVSSSEEAEDEVQWKGFYAARHVLAQDESHARQKILKKIRADFERRDADIRTGVISLDLIVEEVSPSKVLRIFRRANRGYSFYL